MPGAYQFGQSYMASMGMVERTEEQRRIDECVREISEMILN